MPFDPTPEPLPRDEWHGFARACAILALLFAAAVLVCCLLAVRRAHAAPPPNADPQLHAWFETQHSVTGAWCCNVSDGHILPDSDWRHAGDHYEVRIGGIWYPVPPDALRDPKGGANPTGQAIVWYLQVGDDTRIFCFARGFEY